MRVTVQIIKGPGRGREWLFDNPGAFLVGRGAGVDLQLSADDPYVSRRHAYFEISPPVCRLQNLSQKNASIVNRRPVLDHCDVQNGDVIEIGFTQIRISISASGPPSNDAGRNPHTPSGGDKHEPPRAVRVEAHCHSCRTVLPEANADGRAAELSDIAIYSCARCLPLGDEHYGRMVANYKLRKSLGIGGMGAVYLAHDIRTNRVVALKLILDIPARELVDRFAREIAILRNIRLPHVLRYIDSGNADGSPFLVTEWIRGGSLADITRNRLTDIATIVQMAIGALSGLSGLHSKGIIHRDIKPANVLLRLPLEKNHSGVSPVIADFGLALPYARAGGARLTKPGVPLGTVMFMPPEQIRDPHNVGVTADIYAVGVTLYYLLSGRYPFEFPTPADIAEFQKRMGNARNPQEALRALMMYKQLRHPYVIVLEDDPIPLNHLNTGLPQELIAIVHAAIEKDSQRRIQSAEDFSERLQRILPECAGIEAQREEGDRHAR